MDKLKQAVLIAHDNTHAISRILRNVELIKREDIEYGYKAAQSNKLFSVENMKKAIEMARILFEENLFDVEDILGLTEVETSNMSLKYSEDEIIKSLSTQ